MIVLFLLIVLIFSAQGQLLLGLTRQTNTVCNGDHTSLLASCSSGTTVIAVDDIRAGANLVSIGCPLSFNETADPACCTENNDDCLFRLPNTNMAYSNWFTHCSGKDQCSLPGAQTAVISSNECGSDYLIKYGQHSQYLAMDYYCIETARIHDISQASASFTGHEEFLTNQDYPDSITAAFTNGSCSIEAEECDARLQIYTLHLEFTKLNGTCDDQHLKITDGDIVHDLTCEENSIQGISKKETNTNYITVELLTNQQSTGGKFWLGFGATSAVNVEINCPAVNPKLICLTTTTTSTTTTTPTTVITTTITPTTPTTRLGPPPPTTSTTPSTTTTITRSSIQVTPDSVTDPQDEDVEALIIGVGVIAGVVGLLALCVVVGFICCCRRIFTLNGQIQAMDAEIASLQRADKSNTASQNVCVSEAESQSFEKYATMEEPPITVEYVMDIGTDKGGELQGSPVIADNVVYEPELINKDTPMIAVASMEVKEKKSVENKAPKKEMETIQASLTQQLLDEAKLKAEETFRCLSAERKRVELETLKYNEKVSKFPSNDLKSFVKTDHNGSRMVKTAPLICPDISQTEQETLLVDSLDIVKEQKQEEDVEVPLKNGVEKWKGKEMVLERPPNNNSLDKVNKRKNVSSVDTEAELVNVVEKPKELREKTGPGFEETIQTRPSDVRKNKMIHKINDHGCDFSDSPHAEKEKRGNCDRQKNVKPTRYLRLYKILSSTLGYSWAYKEISRRKKRLQQKFDDEYYDQDGIQVDSWHDKTSGVSPTSTFQQTENTDQKEPNTNSPILSDPVSQVETQNTGQRAKRPKKFLTSKRILPLDRIGRPSKKATKFKNLRKFHWTSSKF